MSLAAFLAAAILTAVLAPLAMKLAWATGYLDHPEARKLHTSATALLGGPTVFVCALLTWILAMRLGPHAPMDMTAYDVLFGAAVAMGIGLWDDRHGMQPGVKMFGQAVAASTLLAGGAVPDLGLPVGIEAAVTLVALIALMNAVNFLDNMNGMVPGLSAIALTGFAWVSAARGANGIAAAQLALAGACAGLLPYNFPRARIFLGDAGSMLLGFFVATLMMLFALEGTLRWFLAACVIFGLPILDTSLAVIRRALSGKNIFSGDRSHLYDQLVDRGMSVKKVVALFYLLALLAAAIGVLQAIFLRTRQAIVLDLAILVIAAVIFVKNKMILPPSRSSDSPQGH